MAKPTDLRIVEARHRATRYAFRSPLKFGGRKVVDAVVIDVTLEVETRDGRRGTGFGSMPMGSVWAWPTDRVPGDRTEAAMIALAQQMAEAAGKPQLTGDPLELTHVLDQQLAGVANDVLSPMQLAEPMPRLAQLVSASPVMAAVHDAFGRVLGQNSYNVLGPEFINHDLSHYLTPDFRGEFLDRYTSRQPKPKMPLYHLVGALDPVAPADVSNPVGDGLPESLDQWIAANGLTHLKIKLNGNDLRWDVDRVVAVEDVARQSQRARGCTHWQYSCDFNEKCANVEYVLEFLRQVAELSPAALDRIQYIEQPTHRDLRAHPDNRMHAASKIKPVVIDESLVDLDSLFAAREMGYTGVALKACKGHSEALLMGAAAQKFGMFLCVQDLTCPGASFLHSASLAARIPTIAAIEGNARQYCPAGNAGWAEKYPGMYQITDGSVATAELDGQGLGFRSAS